VPRGAPDAAHGSWARGPGRAVFDAAVRELRPRGGSLPLIAEDLGAITPAVLRLRDALGLPGMVVLQFGFDPDDPRGPHRLENHRRHQVLYTGTHDNDTLRGWWDALADERRAEAQAAIDAAGVREPAPEWALLRLAQRSPAALCMVQAQDVLGLGSEARMNVPGEKGAAWRFRLSPGQLTDAHDARLAAVAREAGR
jgi:4-alpha-glucanotransferase